MSTTFPGYPFTLAYPIPPPGQSTFPQFPVSGYPVVYGVPTSNSQSTPTPLHTAPALPAISPAIASKQIQKLIVAQLRHSSFESIESAALARLELEVVASLQTLYERAHDYADLAGRTAPTAKDLLAACDEQTLTVKDLHTIAIQSKSAASAMETSFEPPPSRPRSPELLPSDDEGAPPVIPATLRQIPQVFPPLPPKHTYLKTPASLPKKAALPSLERKLKNASLVQESLKNLLTATEENIGQEDGELLGHIVNWEASVYPRKRWKVSCP